MKNLHSTSHRMKSTIYLPGSGVVGVGGTSELSGEATSVLEMTGISLLLLLALLPGRVRLPSSRTCRSSYLQQVKVKNLLVVFRGKVKKFWLIIPLPSTVYFRDACNQFVDFFPLGLMTVKCLNISNVFHLCLDEVEQLQ